MWNFKGLLTDSIGSPAKIECVARDLTGNRIIVVSGSSPNAAYEASIGEMDGTVFTIDEGITGCDLQLTDTLSQHLLKDLGHVLSAIRTVEHPVRIRLSNVHYNMNLGISTLNADVNIDIGNATVDQGWLSFALLSSLNTKHASTARPADAANLSARKKQSDVMLAVRKLNYAVKQSHNISKRLVNSTFQKPNNCLITQIIATCLVNSTFL